MRRRASKNTNAHASSNEQDAKVSQPLVTRVREALLAVMDDAGAAAAAKASASRTLLEWFADEKAGPQKPLAEWSADELDAEIERVSRLLVALTSQRE